MAQDAQWVLVALGFTWGRGFALEAQRGIGGGELEERGVHRGDSNLGYGKDTGRTGLGFGIANCWSNIEPQISPSLKPVPVRGALIGRTLGSLGKIQPLTTEKTPAMVPGRWVLTSQSCPPPLLFTMCGDSCFSAPDQHHLPHGHSENNRSPRALFTPQRCRREFYCASNGTGPEGTALPCRGPNKVYICRFKKSYGKL